MAHSNEQIKVTGIPKWNKVLKINLDTDEALNIKQVNDITDKIHVKFGNITLDTTHYDLYSRRNGKQQEISDGCIVVNSFKNISEDTLEMPQT